jgi:hypothetical protein
VYTGTQQIDNQTKQPIKKEEEQHHENRRSETDPTERVPGQVNQRQSISPVTRLAIRGRNLDEIFIGYGPTFKAAIENLRTKVNPLIETPDIADDGNDPEHEEVTGAEITPAMRSEWSREAAAESLRGKP